MLSKCIAIGMDLMHTKDSVYLSHTTDCIERAYCLHVPWDNSHPDNKTSVCKSEVLKAALIR